MFVQGYRANCLDGYFGKLFGLTSYQAGLAFLESCGPVDNDDLGGALLELDPPVAPGQYTIAGIDAIGGSNFNVAVTVNQIAGR